MKSELFNEDRLEENDYFEIEEDSYYNITDNEDNNFFIEQNNINSELSSNSDLDSTEYQDAEGDYDNSFTTDILNNDDNISHDSSNLFHHRQVYINKRSNNRSSSDFSDELVEIDLTNVNNHDMSHQIACDIADFIHRNDCNNTHCIPDRRKEQLIIRFNKGGEFFKNTIIETIFWLYFPALQRQKRKIFIPYSFLTDTLYNNFTRLYRTSMKTLAEITDLLKPLQIKHEKWKIIIDTFKSIKLEGSLILYDYIKDNYTLNEHRHPRIDKLLGIKYTKTKQHSLNEVRKHTLDEIHKRQDSTFARFAAEHGLFKDRFTNFLKWRETRPSKKLKDLTFKQNGHNAVSVSIKPDPRERSLF